MKSVVAGARKNLGFTRLAGQQEAELVPQDEFRRLLSRERKRSERSGKHLLLMLVDGKAIGANSERIDFQRIAQALLPTIRDTDVTGWFEADAIIGVIFTELGKTDINLAVKAIENKVMTELQAALKPALLNRLFVSFFAYPDQWGGKKSARPLDPALYPDLLEVERKKRVSLLIKRSMDVVGSALALLAFSPAFLILPIIIKLTSKGPVFFRQQRIGQYGVPFVFLKFRSMFVSTDAKIHEEYVKRFIAGKVNSVRRDGNQKFVFKITNDPRVTWIGRFMRRTSLDEIPQFWNVLKGQMSLVGPRPPISYELEAYDVWHRRRLLEAKPGITGLWQVDGRSKTTFDEMVRLDLQYSRTWSPLLDLKILLRTPRAVVSGDGAY
ncbi:MAG TPA: sugar transferase [Candidatus Cybelea sp.]|nr:sugar transferase [Candidatus Cybelea sp.]